MKRRIAVVSGTRADYGLLYPILDVIKRDRSLELQLLVTGAHLSKAFGSTIREIEADGFPIAARVDLELKSDRPKGVAEAISLGVKGFAAAYARLKPDILVVLGDRYEILAAVCAALPFKIPVAHIHGGEASEGAWDEAIRHAVTKMSHLHFPAHPVYAERIRQMGENPSRIFCFGSPVLDRIRSIRPLSKPALERALGVRFQKPVGMVTFHPETLESSDGLDYLDALLNALRAAPGTWIFTCSNADARGRGMIAKVDRFIRRHGNGQTKAFASLGQLKYFSLMRQADVMVGNSSSGILEAPYFGLPVANIGERQRGRLRQGNVVDVPRVSPAAIGKAIRACLSPSFRRRVRSLKPRGTSASPSREIVRVLKTIRLDEELLKKSFHDL